MEKFNLDAMDMKFKNWLTKWKMTDLRINAIFLETRLRFADGDKNAAWDMYVELLTRITTQPLGEEEGVERAALTSVYKLFELTRETIKKHGRACVSFTKIAVVVLNQVIRPFTAKWHKLSSEGAFRNAESRLEFRRDLTKLQEKLVIYTRMLADMAGVEDLTEMEVSEQAESAEII